MVPLRMFSLIRTTAEVLGAETGPIIGDGDLKSWDPRVPMIWDNLAISITNCATLTTCIREDPRTSCGFSRGFCHVA